MRKPLSIVDRGLWTAMYNLPYFTEPDQQEVLAFLQQHPFAMLIGNHGETPVATQVPFLVEATGDRLLLRGHMMRHTDHHRAFQQNAKALCVFTGPHTYVSASWYQNPETASTWNYMSVHARGQLRFLEHEKLLLVLEQTTALFENNPESPALFHHLPDDYVQKLASAIVAFEINVESLENVFKLSQNRDRASYENIIRNLDLGEGDARKIAAEMRKRTRKLFT